jgi:DNA-binding XRE family transcriptional regulator
MQRMLPFIPIIQSLEKVNLCMSVRAFGEWLKERREAKGLTGEELAEAVGTSEGTISSYETGERRG